ncbi:hypothetical protein F4556_000990 [Kitasatospora gansuensis]|uniref:Uncharacterized protein n=1 Tax=Kitasatospora gansuensis TaxID=258050 RepID=A0A7W7S7T7_9ACTN|nr:hypothetical protein [Kitasatospora gansuensis]MBB4945455.1 hypothetical protein [Kitasatospora gansuensis]
MSEIQDGRPGHTLVPCPSCGLTDEVKGVPAVYLAGRDRILVPSRDSEGRSTTVTRTVTTAVSDALAPAPETPEPKATGPGCLGALALLVAIGTFIGGAAGGHWFSDDPTPATGFGYTNQSAPTPDSDLAFLGWISGFALLAAVVLLGLAWRQKAAFRNRLAGRPAAEELWTRAWYCARCGTAHFPATPDEPAQALTLQDFRRRIWQAGGYGELAAQHPVS